MIRINVSGVSATVTAKEILTAGRVGLECEFTFDGEWDGLFKTAVFQGIETIEVALPNAVCTVPYEALAVEGVQLKIGVYGANGAGTIVIPTVWANAGKILPSAGAVPPDTPTQTVNAYAVEKAEQAYNIALGVQQKAENGDFDGAPGAPGADGFSPTATVSKDGDTATITITDENGTTTASVSDGLPGADGADGSTLWTTTVEPAAPIGGGYEFYARDLTGVSGGTPAVGDIIFYDSAYYPITSVTGHSVIDRKAIADTRTSIRGATGPAGADGAKGDKGDTGATGPAGPGVPAGGATGQVLKKASGTDYDTEWADESGSSGLPSGGNTGYVLRKASNDDYDVSWSAVPKEVLWVEYGVLTAAMLYAHSNQPDYLIACQYNKARYFLTYSTSSKSIFTCVEDSKILYITVSGSTWTTGTLTPGTYSIPSGGIPASDLASAVQTSLGKADNAIAAPSSPATGAFLVWNGSAWTAQTLSTWQGGSY